LQLPLRVDALHKPQKIDLQHPLANLALELGYSAFFPALLPQRGCESL
jgi:hypothetical protein